MSVTRKRAPFSDSIVPVSPTWPPELAVERRLVDDDRALVALAELLDLGAVLDQRQHLRLGDLGLVAEELRRAVPVAQREPDALRRRLAGPDPARARLGALPLHRIGEARQVDADAARLQRVLRQVEREAVGVVELEGGLAVEDVALAEVARRVVEQRQAARERLLEAALLEPQRLGDQPLGAAELRIGLAHLVHQRRHQPEDRRLRRRREDARGAWRGA